MSKSFSAFSRSSPDRITAVVVPSPTSLSWVFDTSTSIFAAGCWTSSSFIMVAPSLVIVTSPMELTSILSIPRGPRVERTVSATTFAAVMLFLWASLPVDRPVPSFRMSTGTPWVPCADISIIPLFESEIENKGETGFLKVYPLDNFQTANC